MARTLRHIEFIKGSSKHRFVYRETGKISFKEFGTFDLESIGLGGPYADGTTYSEALGSCRHRTVNDLWRALINPPRSSRKAWTWYAHAGARFDFTYIAASIVDYSRTQECTIETVQQGSKIIGLKVPTPSGIVLIYDSFPLLQCSLKAASKAYAREFEKNSHCSIHDFTKPGVYYSPECSECVEYMHQDAVSLWHVMTNVGLIVNDVFKVNPGLTTGGMAIRAWKATIPEHHAYYRQSDIKEEFLRRVGCGSLTYPGYTSAICRDVVTIDRTAAFAACMLDGGYPVSPGIWTKSYVPGEFGMYQCRVSCRDDIDFPVIPAYLPDNSGRKFATGTFTSYITSEQYELALSIGYDLEVVKGLIFRRCEDVFGEFIQMCQSLETPEDGTVCDPAIKLMVKNARNSLNGKFNIRPMMERIYIGKPIVGAKGWIDPVTGKGMPGYLLDEIVDAPYANPAWYALTVTRQQIAMIRLLLLLSPSERGKVDTDSLTTTIGGLAKLPVKIEPGYGNFKVEHEWNWLQSLGCKNYHGIEVNGNRINFCKGIPRAVMALHTQEHKEVGEGFNRQLEFESLRTLVDMFKYGGETPGIKRKRSISKPDTSTGWNWNCETKLFTPIKLEL
jgi:hypothetical protein